MANLSLLQLAKTLGSNTVSGMARKMGQKWPPPPPISVRSLFALPAPPNNLSITGVTEISVSLAWQNNATNAKGYSVRYRQKGVQGNASSDDLPAPNVLGAIMTHTVNNLQSDTEYEFWAAAWNDTGITDSNFVYGKTVASPPKPTIQSFTAMPNVVQICQPTAIILSWQVSNTQKITISRQGNVIVNQTNAGNANPWTASAQDPQAQDTNVTYTFTASSGTGSASRSASITAGSNFPLIHSIQLTDNSNDAVDVYFYDAQDNQVQPLFSLSLGDTKTATFPDCNLLNMKAIDGQGTVRWESRLVLGNSNGQNIQSWFN